MAYSQNSNYIIDKMTEYKKQTIVSLYSFDLTIYGVASPQQLIKTVIINNLFILDSINLQQ